MSADDDGPSMPGQCLLLRALITDANTLTTLGELSKRILTLLNHHQNTLVY